MKRNLSGKTLVFAIVIIFVGVGITPSINSGNFKVDSFKVDSGGG